MIDIAACYGESGLLDARSIYGENDALLMIISHCVNICAATWCQAATSHTAMLCPTCAIPQRCLCVVKVEQLLVYRLSKIKEIYI